VKGFLLDTNAVLFALSRPDRLSDEARTAIQTGPNTISVVTYWEVLLKSMKGTLDVGDPRTWWRDAVEQLAASSLPLQADHVAGVSALPLIHKDPFDRILISQAIVEDLTFVSTDREIEQYASAGLRAIA
jgi:PIN domain nuclease of toxin-antitoxin system